MTDKTKPDLIEAQAELQVYRVRSYDGSLSMACDGWENPCGHIDKYSVVRREAAQREEGKDG